MPSPAVLLCFLALLPCSPAVFLWSTLVYPRYAQQDNIYPAPEWPGTANNGQGHAGSCG
jgi:hypothetical protein